MRGAQSFSLFVAQARCNLKTLKWHQYSSVQFILCKGQAALKLFHIISRFTAHGGRINSSDWYWKVPDVGLSAAARTAGFIRCCHGSVELAEEGCSVGFRSRRATCRFWVPCCLIFPSEMRNGHVRLGHNGLISRNNTTWSLTNDTLVISNSLLVMRLWDSKASIGWESGGLRQDRDRSFLSVGRGGFAIYI